MSGEAIALLIVTALGFLGGLVWNIYWWNRPIFPKSSRYTRKRGAWTVDVFGEGLTPEDADACANAVHAAIRAWVDRFGRIEDGFDGRRLVAVRIEPESWFKEQMRTGMAAFLWSVHFRRGGWYYPMPTIRSDFLAQIRSTGNPLIHEMLHALQRDEQGEKDRDHSDPVVWAQAGGKDSVEGRAKLMFREQM